MFEFDLSVQPSGFTDALEETAQTRDDVHLFSVEDVVTALTD